MSGRKRVIRTRLVVTVDAFSDTEKLESLEAVANFIGLGGSWDIGEPVPKWQRRLLDETHYSNTKYCLWDVSSGMATALTRMKSFGRSGALRAAARLRRHFGDGVHLLATLGVFRRAGEDDIGVPLPKSFVSACARHEIQIQIVLYC